MYAAFDPDGVCLYVGQTNGRHPALRWAEHARSNTPWSLRATRWEVLPDLTEHAAAYRLKPLHNQPSDLDEALNPGFYCLCEECGPIGLGEDTEPIDLGPI